MADPYDIPNRVAMLNNPKGLTRAVFDLANQIDALQSELSAITARAEKAEARIAELEAPVLPGEVARVVDSLIGVDTHRHADRLAVNEAAALLTRLSTVTEADMIRCSHAVSDVVDWDGERLGQKLTPFECQEAARAVLTAYMGG